MRNAKYWIEQLELQPHPEGGFYKEVYRGKTIIYPEGYSGERNISTSIYFLLGENDKSHFHRLKSDEIWYYHDGNPLTVCMFMNDGSYKECKLGTNLGNGESLQVILEAGSIFGAYHPTNDGFTLMGCMVGPGFDFRDFELMKKDDLLIEFPEHSEIILKLSLD